MSGPPESRFFLPLRRMRGSGLPTPSPRTPVAAENIAGITSAGYRPVASPLGPKLTKAVADASQSDARQGRESAPRRSPIEGTTDGRASQPLLTFTRLAIRDLLHRRASPASPEDRLLAAEQWLCRAQDATPDGGISYGYSIRGGWRPSYPETSGYIATTFLRLARDRDTAYAERAQRILGWLLRIQNEDGSFGNPRFGPAGIVFDTGQVLFGLVRGYEATHDQGLLASARRAADWLTAVADASDLRWSRHEYLDTPHVYNTRTAWALLLMNRIDPEPGREAVARSNLDWALAEQQPTGYFEHCAFRSGEAPYTHTIAYATRGLLESGLLLDDHRYLEAAVRCADATYLQMREDGHLPSRITTAGAPAAQSCCLTGNCQFAVVWARMHALLGDPAYRTGTLRALDYVMKTQDLAASSPDIRGAIKGSHPVWGRYASMSFPNWATKFFVDAMWLRKTFSA